MSMDNGGSDLGMENPVAGVSPPKSNKKLWIYGGLGCFGLIGLVCVGCVVMITFAARPQLQFMAENKAFIETSQEVKDVVGSPITVGDLGPPAATGAPGELEFRGSVSGPNGDATYVVIAKLEGLTPVRQEIYLEFDGEKIDLDPDAMFNFEVNDGG